MIMPFCVLALHVVSDVIEYPARAEGKATLLTSFIALAQRLTRESSWLHGTSTGGHITAKNDDGIRLLYSVMFTVICC